MWRRACVKWKWLIVISAAFGSYVLYAFYNTKHVMYSTRSERKGTDSCPLRQDLLPRPADRQDVRNAPTGQAGAGQNNTSNSSFIVTESQKCVNGDGGKKDVFLLILVHTAPANLAHRSSIRNTWGNVSDVKGSQVAVVFLIGELNVANDTLEKKITEESARFHDIVRDNFTDSYGNLTLKTISCFQWTALFCPQAHYVMKTDDDTFINIYKLVAHLNHSSTPKSNFVEGRRFFKTHPIRKPTSKWYISRSEYALNVFPTYLSGQGYVMTGDVAAKVFVASQGIRPVRLEDLYFGLCLKALNITPKHTDGYYNGVIARSYCKQRKKMLTWNPTNVPKMYTQWNIEMGKDLSCVQRP